MERELGDEFEVNDVVLRVVESSNAFSCDGCYFLECDRTACEFQNCLKCEREDWEKCSLSDCIIKNGENG